jgi:ABC-2 type transport system ATP-binding protein
MGELSRGNRQKFGIVQAFMHKPDVIFLDEPSSGLDPLMQEEFYKLVNESKKRGAAIFLSSHVMTEVQRTCDRVGVIREGKLIDEMVISELKAKAARVFVIEFEGKLPMTELKNIPKSKVEKKSDTEVILHMHGELKPMFRMLAKYDVKSIDAENLDLEQMFLGFYGGGKK